MRKRELVKYVASGGLVLAAGVLVFSLLSQRPGEEAADPQGLFSDGLAAYVDADHVRRVLETNDGSEYERTVERIGRRVAASANDDIARAAMKYLRLFAAEDFEGVQQVWRRQGIKASSVDRYLGELDTPLTERHDRRRAFFLTAGFRPDEVEVLTSSDDERSQYANRIPSRTRSLAERWPEDSISPDQLHSLPRVKIVIPGEFTSLKGESYPGAFFMEMIFADKLDEWVIWEVGMYGGTAFHYLLPIFSYE